MSLEKGVYVNYSVAEIAGLSLVHLTLSKKKKKNKLNICTSYFFQKDSNVVLRLDEYFKQKGFDGVHLRGCACCVSVQWLHA